jgi:4-amino-4-deoxy-L-arabinose transferase-like glycosyltransferase
MPFRLRGQAIVLAVAALVFLGCIVSPPSLMDDVDAVQGQIARNMLDSGDWVTPHLNGITYMEKAPLKYWMMAVAFQIFGVHDWASRIPVSGSAVILCWLVFLIGRWAFSERAGTYAGVVLATCVGLFLFTRFQIPDAILTTTITLAMWAFLRALDDQGKRPGLWAMVMFAAIGTGLLIKGLIAALFPVAAAVLFLILTGDWRKRETWKRLRVVRGTLLALAIAAPWHILATLQNPPYFDFTIHSEPGQYRGFFWFYFFNEHLLRFMNLRYPRDYNTVSRPLFWGFHLLWLFPWSVFFPAVAKLSFKPAADRASRTRLLCLCWTGFLLTFFTFSSTQEYYSMPCYPALALLLGAALTEPRATAWVRRGYVVLSAIAGLGAIAIGLVLFQVWNMPAPGDISTALLTQQVAAYTLSLGHMGDLTIHAFAYLRAPLLLAGIAFLIGAILSWRRQLAGAVIMMVLFVHAARMALVVFDPYLSSEPLAEALNAAPHGKLILDDQYYTFSSVIFYAEKYHGERALLLNGRVNNLEYGSYEPGAPQDVFINDHDFRRLWESDDLYYICVEGPSVKRLESLVGREALHKIAVGGGKYVFANLD